MFVLKVKNLRFLNLFSRNGKENISNMIFNHTVILWTLQVLFRTLNVFKLLELVNGEPTKINKFFWERETSVFKTIRWNKQFFYCICVFFHFLYLPNPSKFVTHVIWIIFVFLTILKETFVCSKIFTIRYIPRCLINYILITILA